MIISDVFMPLLNGLDAGRKIKRALPDIKIIFLTVNEDPELITEAFQCGASGYVIKNSAASELTQAIEQVLCGRSYVTPLVTEGMVNSFIDGPQRGKGYSKLTPRQREVLQLLAEGHSMKMVAKILGIAPRTVAFHKYRMMDELHISSNSALIRFAIKNKLIAA